MNKLLTAGRLGSFARESSLLRTDALEGGKMLRLVLALFPWLLLQGCIGATVAFRRSVNETSGDDMPILGLWDPVVVLSLAMLAVGVLAGVGACALRVDGNKSGGEEGSQERWPAKVHRFLIVQRALLRTYRSVLPWVCVIAAITLFVLSSMAYAEGERAYWRAYYGGHMDSVPAEFDQRGPFEGSWAELSKLSYSFYLGYLACFFVWLGARVWIARRILKGLTRVSWTNCPP